MVAREYASRHRLVPFSSVSVSVSVTVGVGVSVSVRARVAVGVGVAVKVCVRRLRAGVTFQDVLVQPQRGQHFLKREVLELTLTLT